MRLVRMIKIIIQSQDGIPSQKEEKKRLQGVLIQNQIKVDKNRKGILFFLDFGPLICGAGQEQGSAHPAAVGVHYIALLGSLYAIIDHLK